MNEDADRDGGVATGPPDDEVLDALDEVERVLDANRSRLDVAQERIGLLREQRQADMTYSAIVEGAEHPLLVELLTTNLLALQHAGYRLRSAEARALYAEGLTMNRIAELFGVSRQRVSALLRDDHP